MKRMTEKDMPADYRQYRLTRAQRIALALAGCAAAFGAAWFVYGHPLAGMLLSPAGLLAPRAAAGALLRRRRDRLRKEFKDMLQALSALLSAGRSVENAFQALESDLRLMMAHGRSDLLREIRTIAARQRNGVPLEEALSGFCGAGGAWKKLTVWRKLWPSARRPAGIWSTSCGAPPPGSAKKMEVELEVAVVTAQKRFEARVMMAMPFVFVGVLQWLAPDYMAYLRQGPGLVVLTVCLLLLAACGIWIRRIMGILP